jgi:hypothetical protein
LVEDGALMVVASTIVPVTNLQPLGRQVPLHLVKRPPPRIMLLKQMAKARYRRLVRHWLAAEIDTGKVAHRRGIVKRLLHLRVRQVEPVPQEIDPPHPRDPNRRAAITRLRIEWLNGSINAYSAAYGTTRSISARNAARRVVAA